MLVANRNSLALVDVLHLRDHPELQLGDRLLGRLHGGLAAAQIFEETLQQLVGIDRAVGERFTGMHLLAITHHHVATQQDWVLGDGIVVLDNRDGYGVIVITLLDLHGATLAAENCGFPRTAGLQQLLNTRQTLHDVACLLTFEHQQG